ncbi:MAG: hypothetical protein K2K25_07925, partial [Muribaculaceae bacterium]|nr:hypothetical protein [Muribaculaceae bacterium]
PKNWVFRLHPLTAHLPYLSLLDAVVKLHEKRPALPEKLNRASQEGKKLELKHFKTMRVKRITIAEGNRVGIFH